MDSQSWVAVCALAATVLGALAFNLIMVSRWTQRIEAELKRQEERTDHLYNRDDRIFAKLEEVVQAITEFRLWIARREGVEEGRGES